MSRLNKVLTVVGARPQFVKAAAVSGPLRKRAHEVLLHTGQHYDEAMSDVFFRELGIPEPDYQLNVGSYSHARQTADMLVGIERAMIAERPDSVLVYGDTNSTLAAALAASKLGVPVVHVEAGLRSFNRGMPEEVNRVVTDALSTVLCCPGLRAVEHLKAEGIERGVCVTGDVMRDVLERTLPHLTESRASAFGVAPGRYLLLTIHRAHNTDDVGRLQRILATVAEAADVPVMFPVHPRTRRALETSGLAPGSYGTIRMIEPQGYLDTLALVKHARKVATDSGGMQKEAYWLGVPCVTLRDETEWTETVDAGWNRVVGDDPERISVAIREWNPPPVRPQLYGDGNAVGLVVDSVCNLARTREGQPA
jgi:UDP-N-acetylglucosamine 2-epimerase